MHQVRLLEGIFQPYTHFEELKKSEKIKGFPLRIVIVLAISVLLSAISAYLGIGTEEVMKAMDRIGREKLEFAKLLFGLGGILSGLLFPLFFMLFFSLLFLPFCKQAGIIKLFNIQLFPIFILVVGNMLDFSLFYLLGIGDESSPFGLGVLTQLVTDQPFFILLMSQLTIFQLWAAFIQVIALNKMTGKSLQASSVIVISSHLIYILIVTISTYFIQSLGTSL